MNLLFVINSLATGGAEKLLIESIPKYVAKGAKVDVLLLKGEKHPFYIQLEKQNCCKIHSLNAGSLYNPILAFKMIPYFKQADIVHAHIFPTLYWVAISRFFSRQKAKFVYTEHSTTNRRRSLIYKWIDRFIYKRYNRIITISDEVDASLKKHLQFKPDRFERIQNGVNIVAIEQAKPVSTPFYSEEENAKLLLMVSRFYYPKDQATVIRALLHLPENIKLLLVGEGSDKLAMQILVTDLKLDERVLFLGLRDDVPSLLKSVDMVILSSAYEGLSLASIEGLASGRPFIASDVPGLKPIVEGAGVLFPLGNEEKLAEKINHLFSDEKAYKEVVIKCKERAAQYDIDTMINSYLALYADLLKK